MSKMTARDKSIILQVIFKEVYEGGKDPALVKADLVTYADMLFAAHDHYEAGGADYEKRGGGGNRGGGGSRQSGGGQGNYQPKYDKSTLPRINIDFFGTGNTIEFFDQRPAKQAGAYSDRAPDFQSVNKFDVGDGKGEKNIPLWLTDAQGNVNEDTQALVGAALAGGASDTSPF